MKQRTEIIIHIVLIVLMLTLALKLYVDSSSYDCAHCMVRFRNQPAAWMQNLNKELGITYCNEFNVSSKILYEGYIKDKCPVVWSKTEGYKKNG